MAACPRLSPRYAMASPWRRRQPCTLDGSHAGTLREVSARGAFFETGSRPPLGRQVTLSHPVAGSIAARVAGHGEDGVSLRFAADGQGVAFALVVVTADMSLPG